MQGKIGELHFTIEVKRASTGQVETYELAGVIEADGQEKTEEQPKEQE